MVQSSLDEDHFKNLNPNKLRNIRTQAFILILSELIKRIKQHTFNTISAHVKEIILKANLQHLSTTINKIELEDKKRKFISKLKELHSKGIESEHKQQLATNFIETLFKIIKKNTVTKSYIKQAFNKINEKSIAVLKMRLAKQKLKTLFSKTIAILVSDLESFSNKKTNFENLISISSNTLNNFLKKYAYKKL